MSAALETYALGKRFRRGWALRDCTVAIPERAIVGLAGPNGAGKSTLLDLAVALLDPTEGRIEVLGPRPAARPRRARGGRLRRTGRAAVPVADASARTSSSRARRTRAGTPRVAGEFLGRLSSRSKVSALAEGDRARLALALALGQAAVAAAARRAVRASRPARGP